MMVSQEDIKEALRIVDAGFSVRWTWVAVTLSAAYRAEKARADLLERQYAELNKYVNHDAPDKRQAMFKRHESERKGQ
jgi:hypothetical protein